MVEPSSGKLQIEHVPQEHMHLHRHKIYGTLYGVNALREKIQALGSAATETEKVNNHNKISTQR